MMQRIEKQVSITTIVANILLFIVKIVIGITFNAISLISDAINSLTDIVASTVVYISIKVSHKKPDKEHQFGHTRSQPLAGFLVAILTAVVGLEILRISLGRLITGESGIPSPITIYAISFVGVVKLGLLVYTRHAITKTGSVALKANIVDHRNDIFIAIIVFIGLLTFNSGYIFADALAGLLISLYIIYSGYRIAKENVDYMMGIAPPEDIFQKIEKKASSIKGVLGLNDIRAHMLGTQVDCEVHIYIDPKTSLIKAHDIGNKVKSEVESLDEVCRAFIHIDPFSGTKLKSRKF